MILDNLIFLILEDPAGSTLVINKTMTLDHLAYMTLKLAK